MSQISKFNTGWFSEALLNTLNLIALNLIEILLSFSSSIDSDILSQD